MSYNPSVDLPGSTAAVDGNTGRIFHIPLPSLPKGDHVPTMPTLTVLSTLLCLI